LGRKLSNHRTGFCDDKEGDTSCCNKLNQSQLALKSAAFPVVSLSSNDKMQQMGLKKKGTGQWIRLTHPPLLSGILGSKVISKMNSKSVLFITYHTTWNTILLVVTVSDAAQLWAQ
jgi:N6-adenosine-specific RNA methylase IME4